MLRETTEPPLRASPKRQEMVISKIKRKKNYQRKNNPKNKKYTNQDKKYIFDLASSFFTRIFVLLYDFIALFLFFKWREGGRGLSI